MRYLRNAWYMAAWSDEISAKPLARRFLNEPVVLFRDDKGRAHALQDRCPHRFAPLSLGTLHGDSIECRYHGLRFDSSGACSLNPHGPVTGKMRVGKYPLAEAYRSLWIWMGDPDLADESLIVDLSAETLVPETAFSKGYLHSSGHYQLFIDNIIDPSHVDFLHPETLGGGQMKGQYPKVTEAERSVTAEWDCRDVPAAPVVARSFPSGSGGRVDNWSYIRWSAPSVMQLRNRTAPAGEGTEDGDEVINLHIFTPETDRSTHYFYSSTRDFALDNVELNTMMGDLRDHVFATQDEPMIRAQQDRMGDADFWSLEPLLLRTDEGAVRVRRKIAALIEAEEKGAAEQGRSTHIQAAE